MGVEGGVNVIVVIVVIVSKQQQNFQDATSLPTCTVCALRLDDKLDEDCKV